MKEKLHHIQFLSKDEQKEIIGIFIKTCTAFFENFNLGIKNNDIETVKKACHNFGSSLIVFELEDEMHLLEKVQEKVRSKDLIASKAGIVHLEKNILKFIQLLQIELEKLSK